MATSNTTAGSTGGGIGDKIKGAIDVVHGSGEALRGTFNSSVDQAGEAVAGRDPNKSAAPPTRTDGGRAPESVAGQGADELKRGIAAFQSR